MGKILTLREFCKRLNGIRDWIGGPQRADLPKVYQAHTPGVGAREQFSSFSASESVPLEAAVATLKRIVPIALKRPGVVIEAEYVEAIIGGGENVPSLEAGE